MGACQSADEAITDPLEQRLVRAVVQANAKQRKQREQQQGSKAHSRQASMASLLLSFPRMRPGFIRVRELHQQSCTGGGGALEVAALQRQAGVLGLGGLSEPAMAELTQTLAGSKRTLDADDLLMVLTIVYFTSPESSGELAPEIKAMLDVVEQAFMHFDSSLDGMLEREELDAVLRHGEGGHEDAVKRRRHKHKHAGVGERLFDLLDFDHSGRVSFKEFILGMEKLVLSELEDEEQEQGQVESGKALATSNASLAAQGNGVPVEAH